MDKQHSFKHLDQHTETAHGTTQYNTTTSAQTTASGHSHNKHHRIRHAPARDNFRLPDMDNNSKSRKTGIHKHNPNETLTYPSGMEQRHTLNYTMEGSKQTSTSTWQPERDNNIQVYANDTSGNMNISEQRTITLNITQPDTLPRNIQKFHKLDIRRSINTASLYWQDTTQLSGYIFSFDNGTGTFVNDTFIEMSGAGNWSTSQKQ